MNQNTKLDEISATSESRGCAKHCSPAAVQTHAPVIDDTPDRMPASLCPERHEGPRRGVNLLLVQPSRCCVTSQARSSAQWTETGCAGVPS